MTGIVATLLWALVLTSSAVTEARSLWAQGKQDQAIALIEGATLDGDMDATVYLADRYLQGQGVVKDSAKAAVLYRKAAQHGIASAQWQLGVLLDIGDGVASDPEQAVALFRAASAQGYAKAFVSLGVMLSTGRGVAQDFAAALAAYHQAAKLGEPHAFNEIGVVHAKGEGVPVNFEEAAAWLMVAVALKNAQAATFLAALTSSLDRRTLEGATQRATKIAKQYRVTSGAEKPRS